MRTTKGHAANVVNGLIEAIPGAFATLTRAVERHGAMCGGNSAVASIADASAHFHKLCETLRSAQRVYASLPGPEEKE